MGRSWGSLNLSSNTNNVASFAMQAAHGELSSKQPPAAAVACPKSSKSCTWRAQIFGVAHTSSSSPSFVVVVCCITRCVAHALARTTYACHTHTWLHILSRIIFWMVLGNMPPRVDIVFADGIWPAIGRGAIPVSIVSPYIETRHESRRWTRGNILYPGHCERQWNQTPYTSGGQCFFELLAAFRLPWLFRIGSRHTRVAISRGLCCWWRSLLLRRQSILIAVRTPSDPFLALDVCVYVFTVSMCDDDRKLYPLVG